MDELNQNFLNNHLQFDKIYEWNFVINIYNRMFPRQGYRFLDVILIIIHLLTYFLWYIGLENDFNLKSIFDQPNQLLRFKFSIIFQACISHFLFSSTIDRLGWSKNMHDVEYVFDICFTNELFVRLLVVSSSTWGKASPVKPPFEFERGPRSLTLVLELSPTIHTNWS